MNPEFEVHKLNSIGLTTAKAIANAFDDLLEDLKLYCAPSREFSIVKTKLEEACFFAKKAIATKSENQE